MIKLFKSVHFYIDMVLIVGISITLGMNGISIGENVISWLIVMVLAIAIGLNGYTSGVKDGIALLNK